MSFRLCATISLVALLGVSSALCAQKANAPTVDEVLQKLEANLDHYDRELPSLFCDEHASSQMEPGGRDRDTVTDSLFRVKRTAVPDQTASLAESREIKSVNGKLATRCRCAEYLQDQQRKSLCRWLEDTPVYRHSV